LEKEQCSRRDLNPGHYLGKLE